VLPVNVQFDLNWGGLGRIAQALNPYRTADRGAVPAAGLSRASP
jgi:hypothetical protein